MAIDTNEFSRDTNEAHIERHTTRGHALEINCTGKVEKDFHEKTTKNKILTSIGYCKIYPVIGRLVPHIQTSACLLFMYF